MKTTRNRYTSLGGPPGCNNERGDEQRSTSGVSVISSVESGDGSIKLREYVNPAVYIETTIEPAKRKENGSYYMNIPAGGDQPKVMKVKRCACFTNPDHCPCHPKVEEDSVPPKLEPEIVQENIESKSTEDDAETVKNLTNNTDDELRISIPSLTTVCSSSRTIDDHLREDNFKMWCARKDEEKRRQEQKQALEEEIKRAQREKQLEIERENFKQWLANKKLEEERKRKAVSVKMTDEEKKEAEKREKAKQNEENFRMWLEQKERKHLEKKIQDQIKKMNMERERQKRLEYSNRAYAIWLEQSKYKPKPLPLGRGLDTLRASVSVSYINPIPWVPNIEIEKKPSYH